MIFYIIAALTIVLAILYRLRVAKKVHNVQHLFLDGNYDQCIEEVNLLIKKWNTPGYVKQVLKSYIIAVAIIRENYDEALVLVQNLTHKRIQMHKPYWECIVLIKLGRIEEAKSIFSTWRYTKQSHLRYEIIRNILSKLEDPSFNMDASLVDLIGYPNIKEYYRELCTRGHIE